MITTIATANATQSTNTNVSNATADGATIISPTGLLFATMISLLSLAGKHYFDVWAEAKRSRIAVDAEAEKAQIKSNAEAATVTSNLSRQLIENLIETENGQINLLANTIKLQGEAMKAQGDAMADGLKQLSLENRALKDLVVGANSDHQRGMGALHEEVVALRVTLEAAILEFNSAKTAQT
jgi:hypothetical protein